jgi:hypothetical protein
MPVQHLRIPKPQQERVRECLVVIKKIVDDLGIPLEHPSVALLKKRMSRYWEDGKLQEDRIPLVGSNRYILYRFPHWAHQQVEVLMRVGRITHHQLPSNLVAELEAQTSSVPPSGPECPSPQE